MSAITPPAGRKVRLDTPRQLKIYAGLIAALSLILFVVGEGSLAGVRRAIKAVGQDSAPSIIAALEVSSVLADLDAHAANYHLGTRVHRLSADQSFEAQRRKVTKRLVDTASNITYGDAERAPIEELFESLGRYLELRGEARYRHDAGDAVGAIAIYIQASDLMHQRLLPAAEQLSDINRHHLDKAYADAMRSSGGMEVLAGLVGALLVTALVLLQRFIIVRTKRIVSPPLALATVIALVFTVYLVGRIASAREDLKSAKEDAFVSIHHLWSARALAYDANGDESRFLLFGASAAEFEGAYNRKVARLTNRPELVGLAPKNVTVLSMGLTGLFADQLNNVTFPGEREATIAMIEAFTKYHTIDGRIRALERSGKHDAAVELCIGAGADQSNAAFDRFDHALTTVIDLNRREFDATIEKARGELSLAEWLTPLVAALTAALAFLGVRPRIREYDA